MGAAAQRCGPSKEGRMIEVKSRPGLPAASQESGE